MTSQQEFSGAGGGVPREESAEGITVRDKRRVDPQTGQVREPQPAAPAQPAAAPSTDGAPGADLEAMLAERTADLQRLQAEYVNYKRRVDRDREATRLSTVASVLTALLPVLDDIGRAREHDELTGGFKAVAESLERTVAGLGLEPFGAPGDAFDPRYHEALMHSYDDGVEGPVCAAVLSVGYRLGERVLRPARVAVAEPSAAVASGADAMSGASGDETVLVEPDLAGEPASAPPDLAEHDTAGQRDGEPA